MSKIMRFMLTTALALTAVFVFPIFSEAAETIKIKDGAAIRTLEDGELTQQGMRFLVRVESDDNFAEFDMDDKSAYGIELLFDNPFTPEVESDPVRIASDVYTNIYASGEGWRDYVVVITGFVKEYFDTAISAKGFLDPDITNDVNILDSTYATQDIDGSPLGGDGSVTRSIAEIAENLGYVLTEEGPLLPKETLSSDQFNEVNIDGAASRTTDLKKTLKSGDSVQVSIEGANLEETSVSLGNKQEETITLDEDPLAKAGFTVSGMTLTASKDNNIIAVLPKNGNALPGGLDITNISIVYFGAKNPGEYTVYEPGKSEEPEPTEEPTPEPTEEPTPEPTEEPTPEPTEEPTPEPTEEPTPEPTEEPTPEPTEEPTPEPTEEPTPQPIVTEYTFDDGFDASIVNFALEGGTATQKAIGGNNEAGVLEVVAGAQNNVMILPFNIGKLQLSDYESIFIKIAAANSDAQYKNIELQVPSEPGGAFVKGDGNNIKIGVINGGNPVGGVNSWGSHSIPLIANGTGDIAGQMTGNIQVGVYLPYAGAGAMYQISEIRLVPKEIIPPTTEPTPDPGTTPTDDPATEPTAKPGVWVDLSNASNYGKTGSSTVTAAADEAVKVNAGGYGHGVILKFDIPGGKTLGDYTKIKFDLQFDTYFNVSNKDFDARVADSVSIGGDLQPGNSIGKKRYNATYDSNWLLEQEIDISGASAAFKARTGSVYIGFTFHCGTQEGGNNFSVKNVGLIE